MEQYVPNGSYDKTSRNIKSTIYASSQKRDQSWIPAGLDLTSLNSADIANLDGVLVNMTNSGSSTGYVPGGSYKKTSKDITVILSAECQKIDQTWQYSSLNITNLGNVKIANIDGVLTVEG
jgi:hypothetical protein